MTDLTCPACGSPLFRLKNGDLWCAKDEKKVIVVKEGEEVKVSSSMAMESLEATLMAKIQAIQKKIETEENLGELQKLNTALSGLLENLERTRKTKGK